MCLRDGIKQLFRQLKDSLDLIEQVKVAIEEKHAAFDRECGNIQREVIPSQSVSFLLWIKKNMIKLAKITPNFAGVLHNSSEYEQ